MDSRNEWCALYLYTTQPQRALLLSAYKCLKSNKYWQHSASSAKTINGDAYFLALNLRTSTNFKLMYHTLFQHYCV